MEITAVTFTNKAANEMKKRLGSLLGPKDADALILGKYQLSGPSRSELTVRDLPCHLCEIPSPVWPINRSTKQFLHYRRGRLVSSFGRIDHELRISKKMMSALIKAKSDVLEAAHMQLKDTAVLSEISKAKAREETPDGMAVRAATDPSSSTSTLSFIAEVSYLISNYGRTLKSSCMENTKLHYEKRIHSISMIS